MSKRTVRETATTLRAAATSSAAAVLEEAPPLSAPMLESTITKGAKPSLPVRKLRMIPNGSNGHHAVASLEDHGSNRQAELFYLQKQIQLQTQMVFILEDGARIQGVIEWYDRNSIKVRGKSRVLLYKSGIKYLYKAGEVGSAPE
jgi:sRNA-binding regulator protein Hfq